MTADADSTLGRAADVVLALPQAREACPHNLAPTTSSLMQLALGDALAIALLESRGFTDREFHVLHPGGRLGALLKFIRDVMRTGASLPLIPLGSRMSDAIVEMSAKGMGCVGVTDPRGQIVRDHHRRRSAPSHAAGADRGHCRRDHDQGAENLPVRINWSAK